MTHLLPGWDRAHRLLEAGCDQVAPADVEVTGTRMIDGVKMEVKMEVKLGSHFGFASELLFQENCR